jgi:peptide/nickel transport system permease protein/oligopeptide transport system permease protein
MIGFIVLIALIAPLVTPANPYVTDLAEPLRLPGAPAKITKTGTYILGSDKLGRDILSRILYGARLSLAVGLFAEFVSVTIGVTLGLIAGYYGKWVDNLIGRLADIMFAFPDLLLCIGIVFAFGPSIFNVFLAIGIVGWAGVQRLVRSQVLAAKESEYVTAARAQGLSDWRIIIRHILPNCLGPIIVTITMGIPGAIMSEAGLAFLGLGAPPPAASWGNMIYDARPYLRIDPWFSIWPGLAIMIAVFAFNLFGDGLRDALDPRLKR